MLQIMGVQTFYGTGPQPLFLAGLWGAGEKFTVHGIPNHWFRFESVVAPKV
jgi:hypothetical protein